MDKSSGQEGQWLSSGSHSTRLSSLPDHPPADPVVNSPLPAQVGRYRIERLLGRGGMGSVYLAHDDQLERKVAVKVPNFSGSESGEMRERFQREARAAAMLDHPNICPVYDVGESQGQQFMAMAYIDGRPLSGLLKGDEGLPLRPVADLVRKLAEALQEAHERGVVHRDLKPANILINHRFEPVIMDFGLARRVHRPEEQLTRPGAILGTPAYMSPEQIGDSESVGPQSDVYSLGVILYELLTGRRPFAGSIGELMSQILRDEPPRPSQLRSEIDPQLERICLRAMAKRCPDRYPSMGDFARDLAGYLGQTAERSVGSAFAGAAPPPPHAATETLPGAASPTRLPGSSPFLPDQSSATNRSGLANDLLAALVARMEQAADKPAPPQPRLWQGAAAVAVIGLLTTMVFLLASRPPSPAAAVIVRIELPEALRADPGTLYFVDGKRFTSEELQAGIALPSGEHQLVTEQAGNRTSVPFEATVERRSRQIDVAGLGSQITVATSPAPAGTKPSIPEPSTHVSTSDGMSPVADGPATTDGVPAVRPTEAPSFAASTTDPFASSAKLGRVDPLLEVWTSRGYDSYPVSHFTTVRVNDGPVISLNDKGRAEIAAGFKPGWNEFVMTTTPQNVDEMNPLHFTIGPLVSSKPDEPTMTPLWKFQNRDGWKEEGGGKYVHQLGPEVTSVPLTFRLFWAGLEAEQATIKAGDFLIKGAAAYDGYNPSLTTTIAVNGQPFTSFSSVERTIVITPLLKQGWNELRIVTNRVENCLEDNDTWIELSGPADWSATHNAFSVRPMARISALTGWQRNKRTGQLESRLDPAARTVERVIPFYLPHPPAEEGRSPVEPTMSLWAEPDYDSYEVTLHSEVRVNGTLAGAFPGAGRETIPSLLKKDAWNEVRILTRPIFPANDINALTFPVGLARRSPDGLEMYRVLWRFSNNNDAWKFKESRHEHPLGPDTREVELTYQVYYAGMEREHQKAKKDDYVLISTPYYSSTDPSVTATAFINGTPLNSFTRHPREVVITPLVKKGENELRIVTRRVHNHLAQNDLTLQLAGPAVWNVGQARFDFPTVQEISSLEGWTRDEATGQLGNGNPAQPDQVEQVFKFQIP